MPNLPLEYVISKNLDAYLSHANGIDSLMPQAKRLLELRQVLLEVLPGPMANLATVANYRQGKIVIFAANSAVAAKLKLLGPALMDRFVMRGLQVTALEIEVQPSQGTANMPPKAAILTDRAREALSVLASQLTESQLKSTVSSMAGRKSGER